MTLLGDLVAQGLVLRPMADEVAFKKSNKLAGICSQLAFFSFSMATR